MASHNYRSQRTINTAKKGVLCLFFSLTAPAAAIAAIAAIAKTVDQTIYLGSNQAQTLQFDESLHTKIHVFENSTSKNEVSSITSATPITESISLIPAFLLLKAPSLEIFSDGFPQATSTLIRRLDASTQRTPHTTAIDEESDTSSSQKTQNEEFRWKSALVRSAESLIGTPYRWGGGSLSIGFDCSGFVRHVYESAAGVFLPRTSDSQARDKNLQSVSRENLEPGDMVFFKTRQRMPFSHVGLYIGEGKFIHSPRSGRDVTVDKLTTGYWGARFTGARRYLKNAIKNKI